VVAALATLTVALLSLAIWSLIEFFKSDAGSLQTLLQRLADIIEASRSQMPAWIVDHLPGDADSLREAISSWLREHSVEAKLLGQEAGHAVVHIVIGMIIGAMVALHDAGEEPVYMPLALALRERVGKLSHCFRQIVFAQVRISAINAVLTAIYLFVVLPMADVHLPLKKSLVLITFLAGLLPVVGNLISNSMLVIVALSHSLQIALASLVYMMVIHKLEYFLNARIIGAHINARAWELLTAMLVMEAMFGLPGVAAAPVFYAYLKLELTERGLV
jgi:predicted PurR-regulated permease PerM